ncbi:MAG: hypothetical protein GX817_06685 [Elusimicrobia bacterium]|nr:hypothetical protein [Elusimicrobiota bacterium]
MILQQAPKGILLTLFIANLALCVAVLRDALSRRGIRCTVFFFIFTALYSGRHIIGRTPLLSRSDEWLFRSFFDDRGFWMMMGPIKSFSVGLFVFLTNLFLWIFVLYASMGLAERIVERFKAMRGKIFPLILMSALTMTSLLLLLQWGQASIARVAGLNLFNITPNSLDKLFFASTADSVRRAFFFAVYFYAAFYLFEYSSLRKKISRWFLLLGLIILHPALQLLFGRGSILLIEHLAIFSLLLFLALRSSVKLISLPTDRATEFVRGAVILLFTGSIFCGMAFYREGFSDALPFLYFYLLSQGLIKQKYAIYILFVLLIAGMLAGSITHLLPMVILLLTGAAYKQLFVEKTEA